MQRYYQESCLLQGYGNHLLSPCDTPLYVPAVVSGDFSNISLGKTIAFVSEENGVTRSCTGLDTFVRSHLRYNSWHWVSTSSAVSESIPVVVIDNHNHALYFWSEALSHREIDPGATLVHIDEHSDLWENLHDFELERENPEFLSRMAVFTNEQCNVGNYIVPAIRSGLISEVIRIEWEEQLRENLSRKVSKNSILNLDLDLFSPDLSDISFDLKKEVIYHFLPQVSYVTIATSPFFIDQTEALFILQRLFPSI